MDDQQARLDLASLVIDLVRVEDQIATMQSGRHFDPERRKERRQSLQSDRDELWTKVCDIARRLARG
jgi:hypothetical protein